MEPITICVKIIHLRLGNLGNHRFKKRKGFLFFLVKMSEIIENRLQNVANFIVEVLIQIVESLVTYRTVNLHDNSILKQHSKKYFYNFFSDVLIYVRLKY